MKSTPKPTKKSIPVYQPDLSGNEREYVLRCIDTNWISSRGEFVERFEKGIAEYVGVSHAIAVCNGTAAVHVALVGAGIRPGDEIIVPSLTYIASVNPIMLCGATPVFVDSDPKTWHVDPDRIRAAIGPRTKAIVVAHLYGSLADMVTLREIADEHKLVLVEDAAEALGSTLNGRQAGSLGHVSSLSFYGNKTITTGEGGMVCTDDAVIASRMRKFRGQGLCAHREYWHDEIGFNFRMTNIAAAIGVAQLERLPAILEAKRRLAQWYAEDLAGCNIELQPEPPGVVSSRWMVAALVENSAVLAAVRSTLAAGGVETRPIFAPIHRMPPYAPVHGRIPMPVAEDISSRGLNLPSWPGLTREDVSHVSSLVRRAIDEFSLAVPHRVNIESLEVKTMPVQVGATRPAVVA